MEVNYYVVDYGENRVEGSKVLAEETGLRETSLLFILSLCTQMCPDTTQCVWGGGVCALVHACMCM